MQTASSFLSRFVAHFTNNLPNWVILCDVILFAALQDENASWQGSGVGGKIPDTDSNSEPAFPKFPTPTPDSAFTKISDSRLRLLNIKENKFGY